MFLFFGSPSQINKNRSGKWRHLKVVLSLFALAFLIFPAAQVQAAPRLVSPGCRSVTSQTLDFSSAGEGPFQSQFFKKQGLVSSQGDFVGFVQGDQALIGPVAGTFHPSVCSSLLRLAPGVQGTAAYTLTAYSASGKVVGSTTVIVTQDSGDSENGAPGYFAIALTNLSPKAQTFTLENQFIRSSFPQNTEISFGISSITYTTR